MIEKDSEKIDADPESLEVKTDEHLWEKIQKKTLQGRPPCGHHSRRRYDCRLGIALRHGRSDRACREGTEDAWLLAAYRSSVKCLKNVGVFDIYDAKREEKNPFINRLREADPELYDDMVKYGCRNIACLTIAPMERPA